MGRRLNQYLQEDVEFHVELDPVAATTTLTGKIRVRRAMVMDAIYVTSPDGFTGHSSAHWTIAVKKSSTTVASYTTDSDVTGQGTLVAGTPKAGAVGSDPANVLAAGDVLDIVITKASTPTAFPSCKLSLYGRVI